MDKVIQVQDYTINTSECIEKDQNGYIFGCYSDLHKDKKLCARVVHSCDCKGEIYGGLENLQKMKTLDNPHLIKIYDVIVQEQQRQVIIIMERFSGKKLNSLWICGGDNKYKFSLKQIVTILSQILLGYQTLFEKKIINKYFSPSNILLDIQNELFVKVCTDFVLINILDDQRRRKLHCINHGVRIFAAPEIYLEDTYSYKSDIYSIGLIIYKLTFNRLPFNARLIPEIISKLKALKNEPLKCPLLTQNVPEPMNQQFKNLINKMLSYKEEDRPDLEDLIKSVQELNLESEKKIMIDQSIGIDFWLQEHQGKKLFYNQEQIKLIAEIHNSPNQNQGTMIDRVNNLVSQLLSKAELAFSLSQILSEELPKAIPDFINYHYQLIQTCLVGYRYKVLLNAQGFCFNEIALICEETRNMAKQEDLKMMLTEYQADKTDVTIQIKENIREQVEKQKIIYTLAEIKVNELTQSNQYLKFNISNFMKLLSIYENTEYKIYIRWFRFFWKHSLNQQLNYIKSKPYDIGYLRLLATIEKFLMVDSDFPTSIDRYYNPLNIIIEETITKEELEAIIEQRKNV